MKKAEAGTYTKKSDHKKVIRFTGGEGATIGDIYVDKDFLKNALDNADGSKPITVNLSC